MRVWNADKGMYSHVVLVIAHGVLALALEHTNDGEGCIPDADYLPDGIHARAEQILRGGLADHRILRGAGLVGGREQRDPSDTGQLRMTK